jgi:hypothetical protein
MIQNGIKIKIVKNNDIVEWDGIESFYFISHRWEDVDNPGSIMFQKPHWVDYKCFDQKIRIRVMAHQTQLLNQPQNQVIVLNPVRVVNPHIQTTLSNEDITLTLANHTHTDLNGNVVNGEYSEKVYNGHIYQEQILVDYNFNEITVALTIGKFYAWDNLLKYTTFWTHYEILFHLRKVLLFSVLLASLCSMIVILIVDAHYKDIINDSGFTSVIVLTIVYGLLNFIHFFTMIRSRTSQSIFSHLTYSDIFSTLINTYNNQKSSLNRILDRMDDVDQDHLYIMNTYIGLPGLASLLVSPLFTIYALIHISFRKCTGQITNYRYLRFIL